MFKEHPRPLPSLFLTEMWERFGFYTIQAILVLYLTQVFGFPDRNADLLIGAYSSLLYLTPIIGGALADRVLGYKRCIFIGGFLFIFGYFLVSFPQKELFYLGLSFVVLGNGLFKPNVSGLLGDLYEPNDGRRDGGFTLFYMGINIGAMIPPLLSGFLIDHFGWRVAFLSAMVALVIGVSIFWAAARLLKDYGKIPPRSPLLTHPKKTIHFFVIGGLALLLLVRILLAYPAFSTPFLIAVSCITLFSIAFLVAKETPAERSRMFAVLALIMISIGFWAFYSQMFSSLTLFAERNMSKEFLGFSLTAEATQFFNPLYIICLSPFLSKLWVNLNVQHRNPSLPMKFSVGVLLMAVGYFVLYFGASGAHPDGLTSPWFLALGYFAMTLGELILSPIGLSMISQLCPHRMVGMMMGVWFLTISASYAIGGELALFAEVNEGTSPLDSLPIYREAFGIYGLGALAIAAVSFSLVPVLRRMISHDIVD
jgi:POT family proton-dependent oligopeptide transporter